jgi:hypothetical protein
MQRPPPRARACALLPPKYPTPCLPSSTFLALPVFGIRITPCLLVVVGPLVVFANQIAVECVEL